MQALSKQWRDFLISQHETGMGYQICDFTMNNGEVIRRVPVYNAQDIAIDKPEIVSENIKSIAVLWGLDD